MILKWSKPITSTFYFELFQVPNIETASSWSQGQSNIWTHVFSCSYWILIKIRRRTSSEWSASSVTSIWRQEPQISLAIGSRYTRYQHRCQHGRINSRQRRSMEGANISFHPICLLHQHLIHLQSCSSYLQMFLWTWMKQVMANQEAVDIARRIKDPLKAAKQLITEALQKESKDDISCIVVRFRWFYPPKFFTPLQIQYIPVIRFSELLIRPTR